MGAVLDGCYSIQEPISRSSTGTTYRAFSLQDNREVAVKTVSPNTVRDEERFQKEAELILRLQHPNTLAWLDSGHTPHGTLYFVTELLFGESLEDILLRGPIDPLRTVRLLSQVAGSLAEAHSKGLIHRDLRPGNIFIEQRDDTEVVKVVGFGVAASPSDMAVQDSRLARAGDLSGSPAYMSPEQVQNSNIDSRSDLYSLGVVAYQCLCCELPFDGASLYSLMLKRLTHQPRPLSSVMLAAVLPAALERLVMGLLARQPESRLQSADHLQTELSSLERQFAEDRLRAPVHESQEVKVADPDALASTFSELSEVHLPIPARPRFAGRKWAIGFACLIGSAFLWSVVKSRVFGLFSTPARVPVRLEVGPTPSGAPSRPPHRHPAGQPKAPE